MHRSRLAAKGQRSVGFAVEGLRQAFYATSNCGIRLYAEAYAGFDLHCGIGIKDPFHHFNNVVMLLSIFDFVQVSAL
jgi:hypothetical protein